MLRLEVSLPGYAYPILCAPGLVESAAFPETFHPEKAVVVSDTTVWALHGARLESALRLRGILYQVSVLPPGEASKSLDAAGRLYHDCHRFALQRGDAVIAFGGGVVGDLAGFVAATYMRGVPFVQVPTTLLAQVDASVGGKVAVNLPEGKNLVGAFYQPIFVLADTALLTTLPQREWRAGMAEVIKYAALGENDLADLLTHPHTVREEPEKIVFRCCRCKAGYVERDERDTSVRMLLNFGHSFGHAIEKYYGFQRLNHGEAVACGMILAAHTGELLGLTAPGTEAELQRLTAVHGLDWHLEAAVTDVIPFMTGDKKNCGGAMSLILLRKMGDPVLHRITPQDLTQLWQEAEDHGRYPNH